jgi:4-amino-4-deoxy-L-arabinose transferase-like glycosyltransferase
VALLALAPYLGWWAYGLFDLDEGFYASVAWEMNHRSEWITPYFNGRPWFEKPILLYWAAKPAMLVFGDVIGPRLPSILAMLGCAAVIAWMGRRYAGEAAAKVAVLVFAGSLLPVAAGRMMLTDPLLVLCLTGALATFYESLVGEKRWRLASAVLLGLSVLAKGPVGCALFVAIVVGYLAWERNARPAARGYWLAGTLLFLAAVASWYLPAFLVNGEAFVQGFLIEQNVKRFTGGDEAHSLEGPLNWIFYIPILLLGMAPWIFALPRARAADPLTRYLVVWAAVIFLFFTVSKAKLPHYVLPCVPPLALWLGVTLSKRWDGLPRAKFLAMVAWIMGVWAFAQSGFMTYYHGGFGLPGFHAEVHRLAAFARDQVPAGYEIAEYRMSRLERALGTGKPKIQETSHPSLIMVLRRTVVDASEFEEIVSVKKPVWILTRWNRITDEEVAAASAAGRKLVRVETPVPQDLYALWELR